jgi:hypothetical protein
MGSAFVHKNQSFWVDATYLLAPGRTLLLVAL